MYIEHVMYGRLWGFGLKVHHVKWSRGKGHMPALWVRKSGATKFVLKERIVYTMMAILFIELM